MIPGNLPLYFDVRYQTIMATYGNSKLALLTAKVNDEVNLLPMLVKNLGDGICEAYSAYGYGGFIGNIKLSSQQVESLKCYLAETGIVSLFIRHSPFLNNKNLIPAESSELLKYTYTVDLTYHDTFTNYLKTIPRKQRSTARSALKKGINVEFYPLNCCAYKKLQLFYTIYRDLASNKGFSDFHKLSESFFLDHAKVLKSDCEFAEITDSNGQVIGGALFLIDSTGWIHYHFSAVMRGQGREIMEYLILRAIYKYGNQGYLAIHLGGGHKLDESDGLSIFKRKFATRTMEFYCSKLICNQATYERERSRLPLKHSSRFLISDARS